MDKIEKEYIKIISEQASSDKKEMTAAMINLRKISDPCCGNCRWVKKVLLTGPGLNYNSFCTNRKVENKTAWSITDCMVCDLYEGSKD